MQQRVRQHIMRKARIQAESVQRNSRARNGAMESIADRNSGCRWRLAGGGGELHTGEYRMQCGCAGRQAGEDGS